MRIKYPNLVRLLMVLAMVCGLVAVVAAPASADVTAATVTPAPASASEAAGYTFAFTTTVNLTTAAVDTISVVFPSDTILPSSIAKENVSVGGTVCTSAPAVNTTTRTVTISIPGNVSAGATTVVISQVAGIKNPSIAALTYKAQVYTSKETNPVLSLAYTIIPTLSISPVTGARGTSVTATGKGWAPNQSVTIGGSLAGAGTVLADGTFSATAVAVTSGAVTCVDGTGYAWTITQPTFTMKASVTVSPTGGDVGATITIIGTDFTSTGNITATTGITLAGTNWGPAAIIMLSTRDAYGTLDDFVTTLAIPANIANGGGGAKTVSVTDGTKTATASCTVNTPTITINPTSGAPNTMVTITGAHFKAGDTIGITGAGGVGWLTFKGAAWNTATITVDGAGNWNYSVKVPVGAVAGSNPVAVLTAAGTIANTSFTVGTRVLTITPASGPFGTTVMVQGASMAALGNIAIGALMISGAAWNTAAIAIDSLGNLSPTSLQVLGPNTTPAITGTGPKTVSAFDGTYTATGSFTVTQPTITISPSTGYKGDNLTVTGAGWVAGNLGLVQIQFAGVTTVVAIPDANGAFTGILTVPVTAVSGNLVGAFDINGNTAAPMAFLIGDPAITLAPTSGPVGTKVTVTGKGFQPYTSLGALTIGGASVLPFTAVVSSSIGKFTAEFTVPGLAEQAQTVVATVLLVPVSTFFTITAAPASVDVQLASISDKLVIVWGYYAGAWTYYDPADPVKTLASLTKNRGYWIKVNADCTLVYKGSSIALTTGWNNIGWPE